MYWYCTCLLYTSDAADEEDSVDLGGRRSGVITHAKFGDDRLMSLGVVAGQISAFPIDFAGRPYNTLTLPCERVM